MNQIKVILYMGILIAIISFLVFLMLGIGWQEWICQFLLGIALIFITVVVINHIWNLLGGEPQEKLIESLGNYISNSISLLAQTKDSGLIGFSNAKGPSSNLMEKLKAANKEVDLMGYSLRSWLYGANFSEEIKKLTDKGVKVRVMVMDESNPHFEAYLNPIISTSKADAVKEEITTVQKYFNRNNGQQNNNKPVFVKVKAGLIACNLCRVDSEIYLAPYLYSIPSSNSPLFTISGENTSLYKQYLEEFNSLWGKNEEKVAPLAATQIPNSEDTPII
ncbi:MAG: hypothetical protein LBH91_04825 [Prevotellaceae bacterium]|nr:hypothetical protein [Prevotellaceae bacterium]